MNAGPGISGTGSWIACQDILASPSGRGRLRRICELIDTGAAGGREFLLHAYAADEFMALVAQVLREGAETGHAIEELRASRKKFERERARKAVA